MKTNRIRILLGGWFLLAALLFPASVEAKCPTVPGETICPNLDYTFEPATPAAQAEVIITARWVDQLDGEPVTHEEWLATREKPAYIWLWDHNPSELESTAYIDGARGKAPLPQFVVPLSWNAEAREYRGSFTVPEGGRWFIRVGTVVPEELAGELEAEFDYVGEIRSFQIPAANTDSGLLARIQSLLDEFTLWLTGLFSR